MGRGLSHVALRTRDIKETERFYTQVLGLKVAFRVGPDMIFLRTQAAGLIELYREHKTHLRHSGS